jgi:hypothetical protein
MKIFYFGCVEQAGHYLWVPGPRSAYRESTPWGANAPWGANGIDGMLAPHENPRCGYLTKGYGCDCSQREGVAAIHYKDGWTAISFWDRSVDTRPGCNSTFLADGNYTFEEMLAHAQNYFPSVMERFAFKIVPYEP